MKIAIIITMSNELEYTKNAIASINTRFPYELVLIDDFSIDGTKAWLTQLTGDNVHKIVDPDTDSLAAKWNIGMQKAKDLGCEAGLICNNDILFSPVTIDNVVARLEMSKATQENVVLVSAHNRRGDIKPPEAILDTPAPMMASEAEGPDFSCFLFSVEGWEKIGKFSEAFKPCYFEDNWTHTVLKAHNLSAISTTAAPYYHFGSITQNSVPGGLCKPTQFERNRAIFVEMFGAEPDKVNLEEVRRRLGITL